MDIGRPAEGGEMKIGDLVKWGDKLQINKEPFFGVIVNGPREGTNGQKAVSYEIAWFNGELTRAWHNDYSLELLSENR